MTPEYISREAALSEACKGCSIDFPCEPCEPQDCEIKARLQAIPAADVVEVRHGRWVDEAYVWQRLKSAQCNQCKRKTDYYIQPNYCPKCGAKMNGGQDE